MRTDDPRRRAEIKIIHVAKKQIGLIARAGLPTEMPAGKLSSGKANPATLAAGRAGHAIRRRS